MSIRASRPFIVLTNFFKIYPANPVSKQRGNKGKEGREREIRERERERKGARDKREG